MNDDPFCGRDIPVAATSFSPRSMPWESASLLGPLTQADVKLSSEKIGQLESIIWNDLVSEHDAENFCVYLERCGIEFTPEFMAFERVWRRDEWNHYLGFRRIYSMIYGTSEESIGARLGQQLINFDPILNFMRDEFSICLLVAYDEIVTTKSYSADYEKYRSFGHPAFLKWIKLVTRDEAYHYHNAMEVVRLRHKDRVPEIRTVVEGILDVDLSQKDYQGTFVLDHTGPDFSPEFLAGCAELVKNYF